MNYLLHLSTIPNFSPCPLGEDECRDVHACPHDTIGLILGGYSYGSLVLTHLPAVPDMLRLLELGSDTAGEEILNRAQDLASKTLGGQVEIIAEAAGTRASGSTSDHRSPAILKSPTHSPEIKTSYLLISPLLPPISFLLNPSLSSFSSLSSLSSNLPSFSRFTTLTSPRTFLDNPTLAIFGSEDGFTSSRKLVGWARKMQAASQGGFGWREVDGAGHFWRERGAEEALKRAVVRWSEKVAG